MRLMVRNFVVGLLMLAAAVLLVLSNSMTTTAHLLAETLIMRGTNLGFTPEPTDDQYKAFARGYIDNSAGDPGDPAFEIVEYPASFWPVSGLTDPTYGESVDIGLANLHAAADGTDPVVIFGYSQSAVVASKYKRDLVDEFAENPEEAPDTTLVLIANPERPNGGILMRFKGFFIPILNVPFEGSTPTDYPGAGPGEITTYDIAQEYDGWVDFPAVPLNLVSTANAILGIYYLHGAYDQIDPAVLNDPTRTDVSTFGDTKYYLIRTDRLPLLRPFGGIVPEPILAALDPIVRLVVDLGYRRDIPYGQPTPAQLLPTINPLTFTADLGNAATQGLSTLSESPSPLTATEEQPTALRATAETQAPESTPGETELAEPTAKDTTPTATTNPSVTKTEPADASTPPTTRPERPKVRGPIGADPFKGVLTAIQNVFKPPTTVPKETSTPPATEPEGQTSAEPNTSTENAAA